VERTDELEGRFSPKQSSRALGEHRSILRDQQRLPSRNGIPSIQRNQGVPGPQRQPVVLVGVVVRVERCIDLGLSEAHRVGDGHGPREETRLGTSPRPRAVIIRFDGEQDERLQMHERSDGRPLSGLVFPLK